MRPCPECSNELAIAWIALTAIVGSSMVWRSWRRRSWGPRLLLLLGGAVILGTGVMACRSMAGNKPAEPACPCMGARRSSPDPVFMPAEPRTSSSTARGTASAPPLASTLPPTTGAAPQAGPVAPADHNETAASPALSSRVIVYYFHRTLRCHSCLQIEEWAKQTVDMSFPSQLAAGLVEWRPVNVENAGNEHFVEDYKLESQALVIVRLSDGKPDSWKNLEKVWEYLGDYGHFTAYVQREMESFLGQSPGGHPASSAPAQH